MNSAQSTAQPKMVVLDGYTLNPGDLSWEPLSALGDCRIYERTEKAAIIPRIGDASVVLTNKVIIDREVIESCPQLRYVGVLATGFNVVDTRAAKERGIVVTNAPGYSTASVAQMVVAHLLHFSQNVAGHSDSVKRGGWSASPDFCYWLTPLWDLKGRTLGLVGFGQIAQAVASIALAFGMRVICTKPNPPTHLPFGVEFVEKEQLFRESDVISLHCPLNESTRHLINTETLALMKSSAILINTGRGDLVDEAALVAALARRQIAGAGLDVSIQEPIASDHPLLKLENCVITPHIAWASLESRERLLKIVVDNVASFLNGTPANVVNA